MDYVKNVNSKFFLLALLAALGCAKEDPKPSLVGTWKESVTILGGCASAGKYTCSSNCNLVITDKDLTDSSGKFTYTATIKNGSKTITAQSVGGSPFDITYELTVGSLILVFNDINGCTNTIYYTKI
jgi:hypothetical protein